MEEHKLGATCVVCQSAILPSYMDGTSEEQFLFNFFALFKVSQLSISEGLLKGRSNSDDLLAASSCQKCQELVNDASEIRVKIEALQKTYHSKLQLLRRQILSGRPIIPNAQSDFNTETLQESGNVSDLRKAIVQLFSRCEVQLGLRTLTVLPNSDGLHQRQTIQKTMAKTPAEIAADYVNVSTQVDTDETWSAGKDNLSVSNVADVVKNEFPCEDFDGVSRTNKRVWLHQRNKNKRQRMRDKILNGEKAEVDAFTCSTCLQTFNKSEYIDSDNKIVIPCKVAGCKKVYKIFAMFQDHHLRTCRKDISSTHTCEFCGRICYSDYTLRAHIMTNHTKEFPYHCDQCGAGQPNPAALARHKLCHTEERSFKCHLCPAAYKRKPMLTYHMRKHTLSLPFVCETCGKRFHIQQKLAQHMGIHSTSKDFPCPVCGKMFVSKHYVYNHVRSVHGRKQQQT